MSVIVTCPNCKKDVQINETDPTPQCECGTTLGEASPEEANTPADKSCPNCNATVPADGVLCTSCGFNFQTGKTMDTSLGDEGNQEEQESSSVLEQSEDEQYEEDDQMSVFDKYKPLIKLVALAVVVLIGVIIYTAANAKNFGINGDMPLGNVTEMESYLQKIGLVLKGEKTTDDNGNTTVTYWDKQLHVQTKKVSNQWVRVHAAPSGKVIAVFGAYDSGDSGSAVVSRTCGFLRTLWNDVGGEVDNKTIDAKDLHAKWTRGTMMMGVHEIHDETVGVTLTGSPYVDFVDSHCHHEPQKAGTLVVP